MSRSDRSAGSAALLALLKVELRRRGWTAKAIGRQLGVAEPTIWRWFRGDGLTLDRLDQLCGLAGLELRDLIAALPPRGATRFTLAQERVLASDRALAFLFFAILNGAQLADFQRELRLAERKIAAYLETLSRLGLIDIAGGRVRPLTTRAVTWRPGGPLAAAFDATVKQYFLTMDFGAENAAYVADMVRMSGAARARVHALYSALRLEIHKLAAEDQAAKMDSYDWTAVLMLVRPLAMEAVTEGF